jgi:hypothetical protein
MITIEISGAEVGLEDGKWTGQTKEAKSLAILLQLIGNRFPFKGGEYFPDPDWEEMNFVFEELKWGPLGEPRVISNTNLPLGEPEEAIGGEVEF